MATEAARAVEAILMVAQEPVEPHLLAQLLEESPAAIEAICIELQMSYEEQDRGFSLVKVAGGYRFQSHPELAAYVERFALEGQSARLSSAALETLAIVAYKQPLSRAQIAAIRGVNVDGVMRTLQGRGYIEEVGRDSGPGQATLFGTSREFLERMGLDRIEDLPPIADLFPSAEVMEALEQTLRAERPPAEEAPADDEGAAAPAPTLLGDGHTGVAVAPSALIEVDHEEPNTGRVDAVLADEPDPVLVAGDASSDAARDQDDDADEAGDDLDDETDDGLDDGFDDDGFADLEPPSWAVDPPSP